MTIFEKIKSMDIDEFVEWYAKVGDIEHDPCDRWFEKKYCDDCEVVFENHVYGWCELNGKCKFFQELDDIPSFKQTIKLWLESEFEE